MKKKEVQKIKIKMELDLEILNENEFGNKNYKDEERITMEDVIELFP